MYLFLLIEKNIVKKNPEEEIKIISFKEKKNLSYIRSLIKGKRKLMKVNPSFELISLLSNSKGEKILGGKSPHNICFIQKKVFIKALESKKYKQMENNLILNLCNKFDLKLGLNI